MKLTRQVGPTGLAVWRLPASALEIMWSGPGARLYLGQATTPGGAVTPIEYPGADDTYDRLADAERAVQRFVAALPADQSAR